MKKKFPILFFVTICFLVPFFIGFVIYDNQFSDNESGINIGKQDEIEDSVMDPIDENLQSSNEEDQDPVEPIQSENNIIEEKKTNFISKSMEKPEVRETLMSLSGQLDDVNISLKDNDQREMVSLMQNSLTAYMNQEDSYKEDIAKALDIYNKLTTEEQRQVKSTILTNVNVSELLFLKKTFGF